MDSALFYQSKSVEVLEKLQDSTLLAEAYINIGSTLLSLKKFDATQFYFTKAYRINNSLRNSYGMQLSNLYLGRLYLQLKKPLEALPYLEESYKISLRLKVPIQIKESLSSLTTAYDQTDNYKKASEYYVLLINVIEEIYKDENSKAVNELSTQYETEKKQQEIQLLMADTELKEQRIQNDKYIKIATAAVAGFLFLLSLIFIYRFRKKKKDNSILVEKNQAIARQKSEIELQRELLQDKNREITDSINYAQIIQNSVLPSLKQVKNLLPESFIYFNPKDIVSGDFYWMHQEGCCIYYVVADCTGHGVPGAMMSMLGASLLNQIILNSKTESPAQILKDLHYQLIKTLNENVSEGASKDGMDIAIIKIDTSKNEVLFAGAGRPLYFHKNNSLTQIKPDKYSIGGAYDAEINFTLHTISFSEPLQLYLFTDGITDQFGGPSGKKFMTKSLVDLLNKTSGLTVSEQELQIKKVLEDWKSGYEQTDDMTLVSLRLSPAIF